MAEFLEIYLDILINCFRYDVKVYSKWWIYVTFFPVIFYTIFFIIKWWLLTIVIWLPGKILLNNITNLVYAIKGMHPPIKKKKE